MDYIILIVIIMMSVVALVVGKKVRDNAKKRYWELYNTVVAIKEDTRLIKEDVGQIRHHLLLNTLNDKLAELNIDKFFDEHGAEEIKQIVYGLKIENLQGKKPEKESIHG